MKVALQLTVAQSYCKYYHLCIEIYMEREREREKERNSVFRVTCSLVITQLNV